MDSLAVIRCPVCQCENGAQYLFCGMCGARLYRPKAAAASPQTPAAPTPPPAAPLQVDRVSLLGLDGEPYSTSPSSGRADYLLEEAVEPPSRRARMHLALALLVVAGVVIAFQWHQYGYPWDPHFTVAPTQTQNTSSPQSVSTAADDSTLAPAGQIKPSPATPMQVAPKAPAAASSPGDPAGQKAASVPAPPSQTAPNQTAPDQTAQNQAAQNQAAPNEGAPPDAKSAAATPDSRDRTSQDQAPQDQDKTSQKSSGAPAASSQSSGAGESAQPRAAKTPTASLVTRPAPGHTQLMPVASAQPGAEDADAAPSEAQLIAEGEKYLYGNGVPQDCERAQKNFVAASAHSATAQSLLGTMYASGHCVARDLPTAYRWYARALQNDPSNNRIESDLKVLWQQMTPAERQLAGGK
jgi:hypothetical protein